MHVVNTIITVIFLLSKLHQNNPFSFSISCTYHYNFQKENHPIVFVEYFFNFCFLHLLQLSHSEMKKTHRWDGIPTFCYVGNYKSVFCAKYLIGREYEVDCAI